MTTLIAILRALRAQKNVNADQRAMRILKSGLGVEARANDGWLLWRPGVAPSDTECATIARDAKLLTGFGVRSSPGVAGSDMVYRLLTPALDDPQFATLTLCPACRGRTLLEDADGGVPYCQDCGHPRETAKPLTTDDIDPVAEAIDWEGIEVSVKRRDLRPGLPLENQDALKLRTLYHFCAFGVVWTVQTSPQDDKEFSCPTRARWAAIEPLEGPHGSMLEGVLEEFKAWFKLHGSLSPLEPPERWRGAA